MSYGDTTESPFTMKRLHVDVPLQIDQMNSAQTQNMGASSRSLKLQKAMLQPKPAKQVTFQDVQSFQALNINIFKIHSEYTNLSRKVLSQYYNLTRFKIYYNIN